MLALAQYDTVQGAPSMFTPKQGFALEKLLVRYTIASMNSGYIMYLPTQILFSALGYCFLLMFTQLRWNCVFGYLFDRKYLI